MKVTLSQIPFLRILLPFAAGIIAELYYPLYSLVFYSAITSLGLLLLWNWRERAIGATYSLRWIYGVIAAFFLFASEYSVTLLRNPVENKIYVGKIKGEGKDTMLVTLTSLPQEKQRTYKVTGEITGIVKSGVLVKSAGKALFYFQKDSISKKLNYGDELIVYSQLQEIEPPSNPDEFDYRQYLQTHGIDYECYVSGCNYSLLTYNGSNWLLRFANNSRKKLALLLHEKIGGDEADIASAILLGYRDDLSRSVVQSFVDSGVVHVICVAGLHVGIIFLLLSYIIVFPVKFKQGKLLSVLIILILLWLYALFTGLATPVLRATIMFSFLTIGRHFRKYTNTVNTLAASAFIMLLFDPFSITDTGFQLSYFAVLGIVLLYKPLLSVFNPQNVIVRKIWELTCVSISAQVAVFPLSLLYFHQFPNYFIITNILVVPLLSLVIFTGIFFFIVSGIIPLSTAVSWILKKCLLLMNTIVLGVAHLPFSTTNRISISSFEAILLFLFIALILVFFSSRKKYVFISGLSVFLVFLTLRTGEKIMHSRQQIVAVYNIPGKTAVSFISGEHSLMPFGKVDSNDINLHIRYNWWKLGVQDNLSVHSDTDAILLSGKLMLQKQFVQFNNCRIAVIKHNEDIPLHSDKLNLNCIIISGSYNLDMLSLKNAFNFDTLVFDSSVPEYKLVKWEAECKQLNLHYYSVKTQGAYIEKC